MEQETLNIYIGFDEKEAVVFHTCVQSIIEKCKVPVSIHPLNLQMFNNYKENHFFYDLIKEQTISLSLIGSNSIPKTLLYCPNINFPFSTGMVSDELKNKLLT